MKKQSCCKSCAYRATCKANGIPVDSSKVLGCEDFTLPFQYKKGGTNKATPLATGYKLPSQEN